MARRREKVQTGSVFFDGCDEDGSCVSNSKVPADSLGGLDGDEPALTFVVDQDRKIAELSGKAARPIKKLVRSGA